MAFTMKKRRGKLDDFHTRTKANTEEEIRTGLEILQEIGINTNVFVPPCWRLNLASIEVLEKLRFKLADPRKICIAFSKNI